MTVRIAVRTITADEHLAFVRSQPAVSFLQTPAWGRVKTDWGHESLGWYAVDAPQTLLGAGLVLYRQLPRLTRYLAYLPEGPVLDWSDQALVTEALRALRGHVKGKGAFALRIGPPVVVNRWSAGDGQGRDRRPVRGVAHPGASRHHRSAPARPCSRRWAAWGSGIWPSRAGLLPASRSSSSSSRWPAAPRRTCSAA